MKKRRGNGSSAFLLRAEREKTHLAAAAAAYGDGREGRRAASPPEGDAAQLLAMDTTKRPLRLTASSQDRGPIWIIVINHASPVYSRAAGPREPRIMRSSATHVAGHPWDFRQAYRLAATVSHPLLLLATVLLLDADPRLHMPELAYAAAEEKKRVVNCVSIQRPPIEDIIHASAYIGPVQLCFHVHGTPAGIAEISLRDTTLAPIDDQDVKGHFGSGEEEDKL
uniref:Uncharacterized protein n=1 Tax=Oryza rufipogon TaxID=4529 RepID=A0A0E0MZH3_ORYRU